MKIDNLPSTTDASENAKIINNYNENVAKSETINELKAFEQRKPKALSSLKNKISELSEQLSYEEKLLLSQLLGNGKNPIESEVILNSDKQVFTKPQQSHLPDNELDKQVFTKPQQSHLPDNELDKVVFTKPQQSHLPDNELDKVVFTKPQQSHLPDNELDRVVFTKPQQSHLPDNELDKVVFTKPQQSHLPDNELDIAIFKE